MPVTTNRKFPTCSKTHAFLIEMLHSRYILQFWWRFIMMSFPVTVVMTVWPLTWAKPASTSLETWSQPADQWRGRTLVRHKTWSSFSTIILKQSVYCDFISYQVGSIYQAVPGSQDSKMNLWISKHFETDQIHLFHILLNSWMIDRGKKYLY